MKIDHQALVGQKFGKLTLLRFVRMQNKRAAYECRCDCGSDLTVLKQSLTTGRTISCGCSWYDRPCFHGKTGTKEYFAWQSLRKRCMAPYDPSYNFYASRGIAVCDRWLTFPNFLEDMGESPGPEYSVDRIDNSKGYSKENCRWATREEQNFNKRNTVRITALGQTKTVREWSQATGIKEYTIRSRHASGWEADDIFTRGHDWRKRKSK